MEYENQLDNPHDIILNVDNVPPPVPILQLSIPISLKGTFEWYKHKYGDPVCNLLFEIKFMIETEEYPNYARMKIFYDKTFIEYQEDKKIFDDIVKNVTFRAKFHHLYYRMEELIATMPRIIDILFDELIVCVKLLKQICLLIRCEFLIHPVEIKQLFHFIYNSL